MPLFLEPVTIEGNKDAVILQLNSGNLVCATNGNYEILKSENGGSTWTQKYNDGNPFITAGLSYVASSGSAFFGTSVSGSPAYLVRSADDGENWTKVVTVESSSLWNMIEKDNGDLYISEYSLGLQGADELYGYNVWKSTDDGINWTKFYTGEEQSAPGEADGIRHIHVLGRDNDDEMYIGFGEIDWGSTGGRTYALNDIATLGQEISINTRDNGFLSMIDTGKDLLFGGDFSPNRVVKVSKSTKEIISSIDMVDYFGSSYDSPLYTMKKGKDGVIYIATSGEGGKTPFIMASGDNGARWIGIIGFTSSCSNFSINLNIEDSKIYISQPGGNYVSIPDYTKEEIKSIYTTTTTIKGTIQIN